MIRSASQVTLFFILPTVLYDLLRVKQEVYLISKPAPLPVRVFRLS